jgi:hypothetical protein
VVTVDHASEPDQPCPKGVTNGVPATRSRALSTMMLDRLRDLAPPQPFRLTQLDHRQLIHADHLHAYKTLGSPDSFQHRPAAAA